MSSIEMPPNVSAALDGLTAGQRKNALALRSEILASAARHPEIGPLEETLKWGEPSYLPSQSNIGSTIRISPRKNTGEIALFFICTSGLMDEFRQLYPDAFHYHGNRAITLKGAIADSREELHHIIALALTSKLRKRAR